MTEPELGNLLDALGSPCPESKGAFTADPEKAMRKLGMYQLPDPALWVVKMVQAAVAAGSDEVRIKFRTSSVEVFFRTAAPLSASTVLDALMAGIPGDPILRHLTAGLRSVHNQEPQTLTLRSTGPDGWEEFTLPGAVLSREPSGENETTVRVAARWSAWKTLVRRAILTRTIAEYRCLHQRCWLSPIPVVVDGRQVAPSLPGSLCWLEQPREDAASFSVHVSAADVPEVFLEAERVRGPSTLRVGLLLGLEPARNRKSELYWLKDGAFLGPEDLGFEVGLESSAQRLVAVLPGAQMEVDLSEFCPSDSDLDEDRLLEALERFRGALGRHPKSKAVSAMLDQARGYVYGRGQYFEKMTESLKRLEDTPLEVDHLPGFLDELRRLYEIGPKGIRSWFLSDGIGFATWNKLARLTNLVWERGEQLSRDGPREEAIRWWRIVLEHRDAEDPTDRVSLDELAVQALWRLSSLEEDGLPRLVEAARRQVAARAIFQEAPDPRLGLLFLDLLDSGGFTEDRLLELAVLACETKTVGLGCESEPGLREDLLGRLELRVAGEAPRSARVTKVREVGPWRAPWEREREADGLWSRTRALAPFTPWSGRLAARTLSWLVAGGLGALVLPAVSHVALLFGLGAGWVEVASAAAPGFLKARNHRVLARYRLPAALVPDARHGFF